MGVVKRQGIKQSIVTWFAMAIGAVNAFFIFPAALTTEQLGILNFVRDSAILLTPFLFWGGAELIVRFFPLFKNEEKNHNGFLFLMQLIFILGISVLTPLFWVFKEPFLDIFGKKSPYYASFTPYILPFAFLLTYAGIYAGHALNFKRAAVPALFNELGPKLGLLLLSLAFYFGWIGLQGIFTGQLAVYGLILLAQIWYIHSLGELRLRPDFSFLKKPLLKEMGAYGAFGLIGALGTRLTDRTNAILLPLLTNLSDGGIYTIGYFIGEALDAPRKAIARIVSPLLSEKWQEGKMSDIEDIYKKSALNQLIVGLGLLLAVWVSIDDLFRIMPNGEVFSRGKYVVLLLGIARLVDMATGANTEILNFSSHFRYNFYLTVFLGLFNVGCNLALIPRLGLNGAALASLVSMVVYNALKFMVLRRKMHIQPFALPMLWALFAGLLAWAAVAWMPAFTNPFFGILVKSPLVLGIFGGLVLWWRVSPDVSQLAAGAWGRIKKYWKWRKSWKN